MNEKKIITANVENTPSKHESHQNYEYFKHLIVPKEAENQCTVAIMEIPPQKSSYPYHFHTGITEIFYIISGKGRLETPDGEKEVVKGDVIVFPPGKQGAHRLMNTSDSDMLVYLDCDTTSMADVAFYPHSSKIGFIIDGQPNTFFELTDKVDYYKGE
jgi:Uncharacterized conserved protein, contains double-stranded beta-helix domain